MNEYLKAASASFNKIKKKEYLINPLSETDGEIMVEIVQLFKKGGYDNIADILKNYKYLKDEEIRNQLIDANLDFNEEEFEKFDNKIGQELEKSAKRLKDKLENKREFITLQNDRIDSYLLYGFKAEFDYDENELFTGKIILNPTNEAATKIPLYANYTLIYEDEEEYEQAIEDLEKQMEKSNIKFINKSIDNDVKDKDNESDISERESDTDGTD